MEITKTNPEDYINSLSATESDILRQLDKLIVEIAPQASRVMWEGKFWGGSEQKIIGYGDFTYRGSNKREVKWFIVGLTAQKNYISLFVNGVEDKEYLAEKYKDRLGKVKVGRSSISFKQLEAVNIETLKLVISRAFELAHSNTI